MWLRSNAAWLVWLLMMSSPTNQIKAQFWAPGMPGKEFVLKGDLNLGGLFPVYAFSRSQPCGSRLRTTSILQYVEAMAYAVKEINNRSDILPNVTLGFAILDTCVKESTALAQALKFLPFKDDNTPGSPSDIIASQCPAEGNASSSTQLEPRPGAGYHDVVGIVGAMKSSCSAQVATICGPFQLPQISYSSTADSLSDKATYPYFSRLVAPDKFQVAAMVDFMRALHWSYVSILHDAADYGQMAYENFKTLTKLGDYEICIAYRAVIREATTDEEYDVITKQLLLNAKARAVILFSGPAPARGFFSSILRARATEKFIWIGSEAWAMRLSQLQGLESAFLGSFTFRPFFKQVTKFHEYFLGLNPTNNEDNPWFTEFWEYTFDCSWQNVSGKQACDPGSDLSQHHRPLTIAPVVDSVYTFGVALDAIVRRNPECSTAAGGRAVRDCVTGPALLAELRKAHFSGHSGMVSFDSNGDMLGSYVLEQVQMVEGKIHQVPIATWDAGSGEFKMAGNSMAWYLQGAGNLTVSNRSTDFGPAPESVCSHVCSENEFYIQKELPCCWECRECRANEILVRNATDCEICPEFTWPDETFRECVDIPPEFMKWRDPTAVALMVFAVAGTCATLAVLAFYVRNRNRKLIKASSRELSYLMLLGILLGYLTVFGFMSPPREGTCIGVHFAFALSFAWIYGPLVTRTNRMFRIFDSGKKTKSRPVLIGQRAQILIATTLIALQVLISVTCLTLNPPRASPIMPVRAEKFVESSCEFSHVTLIALVAYNVVLVTVCTFYAFKTRRLPANYNESRYISLCVYTTLVIWIVFVPSYFSTPRAYYKVTLLSLALLLNDTVALVFLYLPKVYALLWVSDDVIITSIVGTATTDLTSIGSVPHASQHRGGQRSGGDRIPVEASSQQHA